ncbi:MAG: FeoA family protein [Bacteroidia bacterium]
MQNILHSALIDVKAIRLSDMKRGAKARIERINSKALERALLQMGVSLGDECTLTASSILGGPIACRFANTSIALRRSDAAHILISPL